MENLSASVSQLVLGTAQLGFAYGIANSTGQPDIAMAESIILEAWSGGVREFDTAPTYGTSEDILGTVLERNGIGAAARITSKLHLDIDSPLPGSLLPVVETSLKRLKVPKLYCLMLHSESMLNLWQKGLLALLEGCIQAGLVKHIGVSVYSPAKGVEALGTEAVSAVQLPANIFDQRFEQQGVFGIAQEMSRQIYIRSIFLQGLLLLDAETLPRPMGFAVPFLRQFERLATEAGITKLDLALGYVKQAYPKARILFGAETVPQVQENLDAWEKEIPQEIFARARSLFQNVPATILNPSSWPV